MLPQRVETVSATLVLIPALDKVQTSHIIRMIKVNEMLSDIGFERPLGRKCVEVKRVDIFLDGLNGGNRVLDADGAPTRSL